MPYSTIHRSPSCTPQLPPPLSLLLTLLLASGARAGTWEQINATGAVPSALHGMGLAAAKDGTLFLFGGTGPGNSIPARSRPILEDLRRLPWYRFC